MCSEVQWDINSQQQQNMLILISQKSANQLDKNQPSLLTNLIYQLSLNFVPTNPLGAFIKTDHALSQKENLVRFQNA